MTRALLAAVLLGAIIVPANALPLCHRDGQLGFSTHSIQTCLYRTPGSADQICRFFRILPKGAAGAWMECKPVSEWRSE